MPSKRKRTATPAVPKAPLEHREPRPIVSPPALPSPPVSEPAVIVDLDADGPLLDVGEPGGPELDAAEPGAPELDADADAPRTPTPTLAPPPDLRRVALRDTSELWVARRDAANGPPWVRQKVFDVREVPPEKVAGRVADVLEVVHPGLARYLEMGLAADGRPFVVSEWVAGRDLGQMMRRFAEVPAAVPPVVAVSIAAQAARAMSVAHLWRPRPAFHGCLSAANIVVGWDGRVVVTDLVGAVDTIVFGAPIDGREDLMSLCAAFREMLGVTAPPLLIEAMQVSETLADLAAGLERWLDARPEPFGAADLSRFVMNLFAPREPPLGSGWHVVIGGDPYGPLGFEELLDTASRLYLGEPFRLWHEGLERWQVVLSIPRIMDVVDELSG